MPYLRATPIESLETRRLLTVFGEDLSYDPHRPPENIPQSQIYRLSGGDLLAVGTVNIPDDDLDDDFRKTIVSRVNADGTLDTSFGTNGQLDLQQASRVVFDEPRSRFYFILEGNFDTRELVAYDFNGQLDADFGGGGAVNVPYIRPPQNASFTISDHGLRHVYDNGTLLVEIEVFQIGKPRQYQLMQIRPDGSLNTGFANNGHFVLNQDTGTPTPFVTETALYVHIDYGFLTDPPSGDLLRFTENGKRKDLNFSGDGKLPIVPFAEHFIEQPDGKLLFLGTQFGLDPVLFRINANGTPDTSFSGDGKITLSNPDDTNGGVAGMFLDSANRIVVAAEDTLYRFSPTGQLDNDPIYNGTVFFDGGGAGELSYENGDDDVILVGGEFGERFASVPEVQVANDDLGTPVAFVALDDDDDTITITQPSAATVRFVINGQTFNFARNEFSSIRVEPRNGDAKLQAAVDLPIEYSGGNGDDTIVTGSGQDTITTIGGESDVNSGDGDDIINVGSFNGDDDEHTIIGGTGNKRIVVQEGAAAITLGRGDHDITTSVQSSGSTITINGGGRSSVRLGADNDALAINGRGSNSVVVFEDAVDARVTTGSGNDEIIVLSATAIIRSNGGNDRITTRISENETTGPTIFAGSGDDHLEADPTFAGMAEMHGGDGNDSLVGGRGRQSLYGEGGKDTLIGGEGADLLSGGGGNDSLQGGPSKDRLYGGDGNDILFGDSGDDQLFGQNDRDKLYGGADDDRLFGGANGDWLYSQRGNDELFGEGGDDQLFADYDQGTQTLHGGAGDDRFVTADDLQDQVFGDGGTDELLGDSADQSTSIELTKS